MKRELESGIKAGWGKAKPHVKYVYVREKYGNIFIESKTSLIEDDFNFLVSANWENVTRDLMLLLSHCCFSAKQNKEKWMNTVEREKKLFLLFLL